MITAPSTSMLRPGLALGAMVACVLLTGSVHAQNAGSANTDIDQVIEELAGKDLIDKRLEQEVESQWKGNQSRKLGSIGKSKAKSGGWPGPVEEIKVRFIRLDHGGRGWDDGMDKTGADANFLKELAKQTGLKTAEKGESHAISLLKKYPKDGFPPFVFITGNDKMGRISARDLSILRGYCMKGGMIIADAGSASFHQSFVHTMRQVFPDKKMLDIANDDLVYQLPFAFSKGAPAFWAHGGRRPLGIKHEGRWVVFYHPGDMNDAWKSEGYIDCSPEIRRSAISLGINLVFYAYTQWDNAIAEQEKGEN